MFNSQSYGKWEAMLKQLIPDTCSSRLTNFALLLVGIYESQSVYLSGLSRKIPIRAKKLSIAKRFERFLDNKAVKVEDWYHPWASWLIQSASAGGTVHLVIDSTKVSAYCRKVMVAVAYQRRTLPIMWDWVMAIVSSVVVSGGFALSASDDQTVRVWNWTTGDCLYTLHLEARIWSVAITEDRSHIVAGDEVGNVHFLRLNAAFRRLIGAGE